MISASCPVEATHSALTIVAGGRVQPRPGGDQRLVGQLVDGVQARAGVDRTRLGHL